MPSHISLTLPCNLTISVIFSRQKRFCWWKESVFFIFCCNFSILLFKLLHVLKYFNIWSMIFLPLLKRSQWHWKPCFLKSKKFSKNPAFHFCSMAYFETGTEHISELGLEIWKYFARTLQIFFIDKTLSGALGLLMFLSFPFPSLLSLTVC